jgi:glutamate-5-semialdehyde dehydrogenase
MIGAMLDAAGTSAEKLALAGTGEKDRALRLIAAGLRGSAEGLLNANGADVREAAATGLPAAMIDRLRLDPARIEAMARSVEEVALLEDPVGEIHDTRRRPNGLLVARMRIPLGVIGLIFESRPNVLAEAAALCLKSGNALVARGGREAASSCAAIGGVISAALEKAGLPPECVQVAGGGDRAAVLEMLQASGRIDLLIPRGGESLVRFVSENARVPWVGHFTGVCHVFVDRDADTDKAEKIVFNAKVQRPGVCNAMETLLVDAPIAESFLPAMCARLASAGVEIRGCPETRKLFPAAREASSGDYGREFLDLILAVKVVDGIDGALDHIARHSSRHTEAIVTENHSRAMRFLRCAGSSCVLMNASTRFNDGGELGLGAELGISTTRMHAFGPMGLRELTVSKFIVLGEGQIRG